MRNYLEGWKNKNEITVPKNYAKGFREQIIIRKPVEPVRKQTSQSYNGEDATVFVTQQAESSAYIKRLKTGEEVKVDKDRFVIGKLSEADYIIADNPTVSRRHAEILYTGDGYYLIDMNSSNHVFVDGNPITKPVKLTNHMVFRLSDDENIEFTVRT